ncbi:polysaccharide biosynthesis C-terminal domain-containing protein [Halomontanus rarus]|uniref:oligosaccharide flippase family protein n=1 Tax=Halomontanus rarus TaxID=3034020 RepID=UPI001A984420
MADSISSAFVSVFFSKLTVLLIAFLFTPALVRLLGPTGYGQYALVLSIFGIVNDVIIGGTSDAVRKYISERSEPDWQATVFGYVFRPALGFGVFTGVGFFIAAWSGLAAAAFGEAFTSLFYLLAVYAVTEQLSYHNVRTLMGLELESRSEPLKVLEKALFVVLALTFLSFGLGVDGVLTAHIVTSAVVLVLALGFVSRRIPIRSIVSPLNVSLPRRQIVGYIGSTMVFFLLLNSLYHVDVILLQYWTTDEVVGYYRGALSIAEFLWLAPLAVQLVLLQRISHLWEQGDIDTIQQQSQLVTRYVFLFTALLAIGVAALAADFVPLYLGPAFEPAITPLLLLLPGVVGFAVARPTLAINQGRRSLRPLLFATGACSLVNLLLNLLLIPQYGMVGAAIATSVGYGSLVVFQSMAARHLGYRPLTGLRGGPTLLTIFGSTLVIFPVAELLSSSIVALVVVPPLGAGIYGLMTIASGAVTPAEVRDVVERVDILPNPVERRLVAVIERIPTLQK